MVPLQVTSPKTIFNDQLKGTALNSQARGREMEWKQDQRSSSSSVASLISDFQRLLSIRSSPQLNRSHEALTLSAASWQALLDHGHLPGERKMGCEKLKQ